MNAMTDVLTSIGHLHYLYKASKQSSCGSSDLWVRWESLDLIILVGRSGGPLRHLRQSARYPLHIDIRPVF